MLERQGAQGAFVNRACTDGSASDDSCVHAGDSGGRRAAYGGFKRRVLLQATHAVGCQIDLVSPSPLSPLPSFRLPLPPSSHSHDLPCLSPSLTSAHLTRISYGSRNEGRGEALQKGELEMKGKKFEKLIVQLSDLLVSLNPSAASAIRLLTTDFLFSSCRPNRR